MIGNRWLDVALLIGLCVLLGLAVEAGSGFSAGFAIWLIAVQSILIRPPTNHPGGE